MSWPPDRRGGDRGGKNSAKFKDVSAMTHKLRAMDCNIVGSVFNQG